MTPPAGVSPDARMRITRRVCEPAAPQVLW
jgi:hypothetical protein